MREILFRGKRTDNGKWIYGNYCYAELIDKSGYEDLIIEQPADGETRRVIPETVGQYTGLTDKNGKKIFEGDIVLDEQSGYKYFIKWFPEYTCFALANKSGHMEFGCDEIEIFLNDLVVVDNIHDNPESLKGE